MDAKNNNRLRVAVITAGLYFDPEFMQDVARYESISGSCSGEVFASVYAPQHNGVCMGTFTVNALVLRSEDCGYGLRRGMKRALLYCSHVLGHLWRRRKERPYDVLVAHEPFKAGMLAYLGSRLLGAPYAVELNGNYAASLRGMKGRIVRRIVPFVVSRADAVKLLYDEQLSGFGLAPNARTFVFHNLVHTGAFRSAPSTDRYVLFMGHPWKLKGVDVLIKAFREIADEFPDVHLTIVGDCPEPAEFAELAAAHPRIHLHKKGVPHAEAAMLMNSCEVFVLPSRTEGMGRVLLEAMSACKPVIGSRVDGIPRVVRHEHNGLLFESENSFDLARQLRRVLADRQFAATLAQNGFDDVHTRLSATAYATQYLEFLHCAVRSKNNEHGSSVTEGRSTL